MLSRGKLNHVPRTRWEAHIVGNALDIETQKAQSSERTAFTLDSNEVDK